MAYTPGFKYDIFISYARDDNAVAPKESQGWVADFKETLEHWLIKRRHLKGLKIWFDDDDLSGNSDFNAAIKDGIEHSALFFILNSHHYQQSDYCKKELNWFLALNEHRPGGIMIGDLMRPFNLLLNNIHFSHWPSVLQEKMCFHLHDAPPKSEDFGDRLDIGSAEFTRQMSSIVSATVNTLETLKKQNQTSIPDKTPEKADNKPTVFFADVAHTLNPFRKRLAQELATEASVLPMMPPPYDPEPHQLALQGTLDQAELTVHLLDQWGGSDIQSQETTFPRLHAETACPAKLPTLIWVPDTLEAGDFEDETQAKWLHALEHDERPEHNYRFVRSSRQALTDQIRQMLAELQQQRPTLSLDTRFMIDTHQKDLSHTYKLAGLLAEYGIDAEFNKEYDDPVNNLEAFDRAVREVQHLIITFGTVTRDWLKRRIERAMQVQVSQFSQDADSAQIWVFLPPGVGMADLPKTPHSIRYLRCHNGNIDQAAVQPLLDDAGETA